MRLSRNFPLGGNAPATRSETRKHDNADLRGCDKIHKARERVGVLDTHMQNSVTTRPVSPSDAHDWLKLRCDLWPEGVEDHRAEIASFFTGNLVEPIAVFVAVDATDRVIGFVELSTRRNLPNLGDIDAGFIEGLYVVPERRFCGVARALVETGRDWARKRGCKGFASDRSSRYIIDKRFT